MLYCYDQFLLKIKDYIDINLCYYLQNQTAGRIIKKALNVKYQHSTIVVLNEMYLHCIVSAHGSLGCRIDPSGWTH